MMRRFLLPLGLAWLAGAGAEQLPAPQSPPRPQVSEELPAVYQPRRLTVDGINRQTEIIRNPGLAVDNARIVLAQSAQQAFDSVKPGAAPLPLDAPGKVNDPTLMTGSFTQALGRVNGKGGNGAANAPLPELQLVAKSLKGGNKTAMIQAGGRTHMVKEGERISLLLSGVSHEVQVNRIDADYVEVMVTPANRLMILQ